MSNLSPAIGTSPNAKTFAPLPGQRLKAYSLPRTIIIAILTILTVVMVIASLATQANMYCLAITQVLLGAQFLARHLRLQSDMSGFEKLSIVTGLICLAIGLIILALGIIRG